MSGQGPESCQERYHDDLAAYALGALSGDELKTLELHLHGCEACQGRLQWLQPAIDLLPAAIPQYEPPETLREGLMAIVREEAAEAAPARRRSPARWRARIGDTLRRLVPMRPALAALAGVALIAAAVGGYALRGGTGEQAESFAIKSVSPKSAASGTVEVSDGSATISLENVPPIPADEVYQLWTVRPDENPMPSSIFVAETGGRATATIPEIPEGTSQVLVTTEPDGGSREPTTAAVLAAELD